jgi:hypothetical protein
MAHSSDFAHLYSFFLHLMSTTNRLIREEVLVKPGTYGRICLISCFLDAFTDTLSIGQTESKERHLQRLLLCLSCRQCPCMLQRTQKLLFADEIYKIKQTSDSSLLGIFQSTLMSPERTLPLAFSSVLSKGPFLIRQRAYCSPAQIIYECVEPRWNDTDRGTERLGEKPCPSVTLSTTNPTYIDPGPKTGLRGD